MLRFGNLADIFHPVRAQIVGNEVVAYKPYRQGRQHCQQHQQDTQTFPAWNERKAIPH